MKTLLSAALAFAAVLLTNAPSFAQESSSYDMTNMDSTGATAGTASAAATPGTASGGSTGWYDNSTYGAFTTDVTNVYNTPYQQQVFPGVGMQSNAQMVPGSYVTTNADGTQSVTRVMGNDTRYTDSNTVPLWRSGQGLLAPGSWFGNTDIPTAESLGFPTGAPKFYKGVSGFIFGGVLPQTSTAGVNLNIVE